MKKLILNSICILGIVLLCSCSNTSVSVAPRSEKTPHATEEKSKSHETKTENVNTKQLGEPVGIAHLYVVVQQQQIIARRRRESEVVAAGEP